MVVGVEPGMSYIMTWLNLHHRQTKASRCQMPSSDLGFHTRDQGAPNHLRGVPTPVGQQPRWLQISITISAELHRGKCHLDWQNSPSMRREGHGRE